MLQRFGIRNSRNKDSHLSTNMDRSARYKSVGARKIEDSFVRISTELPQYVVGQKEYLDELAITFKKMFLVEKDDKSYRGICIVLGPAGTGRKYSIKVLAKLLKIAKIVKDSSLYILDFSAYTSKEDVDKLFFPDMYRAFYSDAPIVVFDNVDKACSDVIHNVETLGIEGKLKTNKRFGWSRGEFQENTGSYAEGLSDYISANGKIIVLISAKKKEQINSLFKKDFLDTVDGIVETSQLNKEALIEITDALLNEYTEKIMKLSGKQLVVRSFTQPLLSLCNKKDGIHSIEAVLETDVFKPLIDAILKEEFSGAEKILLKINEDDEIYANDYCLGRVHDGRDEEQLLAVKKEMDSIIGLSEVKEFVQKLEENIDFQKKRQSVQDADISLHMIFTGNPGTGKTTIARIVSKYLKALGVLSEGHLVEASRSDLVGQYLGETAQKTRKVIDAAIGGVLFIDEAYSLAIGSNDQYGLEAINTLVKCMEDYRDDLVVILAGYTKEIKEFLNVNSGLQSRFNYNIEFPDYTPNELVDITHALATSKKYTIDEKCEKKLLNYYSRTQIPGKNDSGNGRMARNLLEKAITTHSHRMMNSDQNDDSLINTLMPEDFGLDEEEFDLEKELDKIIGLQNIKDFVRNLDAQLTLEKRRQDIGVEVNTKQSFNMLFIGNPGTGKTYVARLLAKIFHKTGYLPSNTFIETDRSGLVAEYAGQTASKTTDLFSSALGGVLFIDEAYSLTASSQFDKEAIDTLVKLIEDNTGNIVVILAGYRKEMQEFLNANSGLRSRFNITMDFPDYSEDELCAIMDKQAETRGFQISSDAYEIIRQNLASRSNYGNQSGNARLTRNILEEAIRAQTDRLTQMEDVSKEDLLTLTQADFTQNQDNRQGFDLEARLKEIVGLDDVKDFVRTLYNVLKLEQARKEMGIFQGQSQTLHMIFTGNPGTGKTTVARLIGEILYELGILNSKNFVETDRAGLVAGYVGQTAIKTKTVISQAMDGVLFVDEAYSLANGGENDFGKEAIDTIVKDMDDNREHLVVILAGYRNDMERFLGTNPGLKSRFPNVVEFHDYLPDELVIISEGMLRKNNYTLSDGAKTLLKAIFEKKSKERDFGNGRFARNMCEQLIRNLSNRLSKMENYTVEDLTTILPDDVY